MGHCLCGFRVDFPRARCETQFVSPGLVPEVLSSHHREGVVTVPVVR